MNDLGQIRDVCSFDDIDNLVSMQSSLNTANCWRNQNFQNSPT